MVAVCNQMQGVRNKDVGPAGESLRRMVGTIRGFDIDALKDGNKQGFLAGIWGWITGRSADVHDYIITTTGRSKFADMPPFAKRAAVSIHRIGQDEKRSSDKGNYKYEVISVSEKLIKSPLELPAIGLTGQQDISASPNPVFQDAQDDPRAVVGELASRAIETLHEEDPVAVSTKTPSADLDQRVFDDTLGELKDRLEAVNDLSAAAGPAPTGWTFGEHKTTESTVRSLHQRLDRLQEFENAESQFNTREN